MRDIYERALEALIWLGEAADKSELAFHFVELASLGYPFLPPRFNH
jgi:hypothetical protein